MWWFMNQSRQNWVGFHPPSYARGTTRFWFPWLNCFHLSKFQEISNRTHWTDPEQTWVSNSSFRNFPLGFTVGIRSLPQFLMEKIQVTNATATFWQCNDSTTATRQSHIDCHGRVRGAIHGSIYLHWWSQEGFISWANKQFGHHRACFWFRQYIFIYTYYDR